MIKKPLSITLDLVILLSALLFSIVGKDLSTIIFQGIEFSISDFSYATPINLLIVLLASSAYIIIQFININAAHKGFMYSLIGFVSCVVILTSSSIPSMMIFFCQIFIFIVSAFCFSFRPYLSLEMEAEFWKVVFEALIKIIQISLVVYVAVIATLRFVNENDGSYNYMGFSTTIFYPTIIYLSMLFMFGYWVIYPVWENFLMNYKKNC